MLYHDSSSNQTLNYNKYLEKRILFSGTFSIAIDAGINADFVKCLMYKHNQAKIKKVALLKRRNI